MDMKLKEKLHSILSQDVWSAVLKQCRENEAIGHTLSTEEILDICLRETDERDNSRDVTGYLFNTRLEEPTIPMPPGSKSNNTMNIGQNHGPPQHSFTQSQTTPYRPHEPSPAQSTGQWGRTGRPEQRGRTVHPGPRTNQSKPGTPTLTFGRPNSNGRPTSQDRRYSQNRPDVGRQYQPPRDHS